MICHTPIFNWKHTSKKCFNEDENKVYKLELHYNTFAHTDLKEFIANLNKQKELKILDLSWNKIGNHSDTVRILAENLKENTTLKHFDISHNGIKKADFDILQENINHATPRCLSVFSLSWELCMSQSSDMHIFEKVHVVDIW